MIPTAVGGPVEGYAGALGQVAADRLAAIYVVGGLALGDFSDRQSNIDLVVVCDPPLEADQRRRLRRAEHGLERAGRPAVVWYTTWTEVADGREPDRPPDPLDTPLTRNLLRNDAIALQGPDWPVVAYDQAEYRRWCRARLDDLVAEAQTSLLMRRHVSSVVLEAARVAQGALTGRVYSKTEAGEAAQPLVPSHFRRILHDSAGYRQGATTSMYWGPFERKFDARVLIGHLVEAVDSAPAGDG